MIINLMHKDMIVAKMELSPSTFELRRIFNVSQSQHMPQGTYRKSFVIRSEFERWWRDRRIPSEVQACRAGQSPRDGSGRSDSDIEIPQTSIESVLPEIGFFGKM
ncbi:MAG: hypothetical protein IKQ60_01790 [Candidatus Methanomethylophilaceae archaeon]|nr:hypothetical protein [Candidatus Methanomethylophilaceae archaeon]